MAAKLTKEQTTRSIAFGIAAGLSPLIYDAYFKAQIAGVSFVTHCVFAAGLILCLTALVLILVSGLTWLIGRFRHSALRPNQALEPTASAD